MMNNIQPVSFTARPPRKKTIGRVLKSYYYASKPMNTIRKGAEKLPVLTRIKKFFTSIINANKNYFKA